MHHRLYTLPLLGLITSELIPSTLDLIPDRGAPGLGFVEHPFGILREAGGHGIGLSRFEKQQVLIRSGLVKGVIHVPFPGYPVKYLGISGQLQTVGRYPMPHKLLDRLLAVRGQPGAVILSNFAPNGGHRIG